MAPPPQLHPDGAVPPPPCPWGPRGEVGISTPMAKFLYGGRRCPMPRNLPLGNGVLQVNFDLQHQLVDLYYPHVGGENHALGHPFRTGLWVGGQFSWTSDASWRRTLRYQPETLVTDATLEHPALGIRLRFAECVDFHVNAFVRRVSVANLSAQSREVRLFFHHDFHIRGTEIGDAAYFDPNSRGLFHYKGPRWFHANVLAPGGAVGWSQYATGIKEWGNREGTWRDAEDGILGMNPIAQGSVDSTGGVSLTLAGGAEQVLYYWLLAGETYEELRRLNRLVQARGPEGLLRRTADYWRQWISGRSRPMSWRASSKASSLRGPRSTTGAPSSPAPTPTFSGLGAIRTPTCGHATEPWWLGRSTWRATTTSRVPSTSSARRSRPTRGSSCTSTIRTGPWARPGTRGWLMEGASSPSKRMKQRSSSGRCGSTSSPTATSSSSSRCTGRSSSARPTSSPPSGTPAQASPPLLTTCGKNATGSMPTRAGLCMAG